MFTIEEAIELPVPLARMWRLIADIDRFHEWHPFAGLSRHRVDPAKVSYTFRWKGKNLTTADSDLTRFERHKAIAWRTSIGPLLAFEESFELEKQESGTRVIHRVRCSGVFSPLIIGRMRRSLRAMVTSTNASLGRHALRGTTIARYSQASS